MLSRNPVAVITPFNSSRLPRKPDLDRLSSRTSELFCTAAGPGKALARDAVVERTMREQARERTIIDGLGGHVRVRWQLNGQPADPTVELFNGAYQINPR